MVIKAMIRNGTCSSYTSAKPLLNEGLGNLLMPKQWEVWNSNYTTRGARGWWDVTNSVFTNWAILCTHTGLTVCIQQIRLVAGKNMAGISVFRSHFSERRKSCGNSKV